MDTAVIVALISAGGALVVALIGLRRTSSLREDFIVASAEELTNRKLSAWAELWEITSVAKPSNPDIGTMEKRNYLEKRMSEWYFKDGAGMWMSLESRNIFLDSKQKLLDQSVDSHHVVRQLSTLRSQIRGDITGSYEALNTFKE